MSDHGTPMLGPAHRDFDKVAESPPSNAPSSQVTLPALPEIERWADRTRREREALRARADRLRQQFEPLRKELAGIERCIKVLDHFLSQVAIDGGDTSGSPTPISAAHRRGGRLLSGQWSRKHDACLMCRKTENRHKGVGYCSACYDKRDRSQTTLASDGVTS